MKNSIKAFFTTLAVSGVIITITALILIINANRAASSADNIIYDSSYSHADVSDYVPSEIIISNPSGETSSNPFYEESLNDTSCLINPFPVVYQNPELPTGCEVTSLCMLLNYLGFDISKTELSDNYLPKADFRTAFTSEAFIGNPRSSASYGCYAPVIVECARKYLKLQNTDYKIYNYSGSDFSVILNEVLNGHPALVWSTISLVETYPADSWIVNGEVCQWYVNEHCVVLIGFDTQKNQVTVADPLSGIVTRDLDLFETRYNEMFKQAVFIY